MYSFGSNYEAEKASEIVFYILFILLLLLLLLLMLLLLLLLLLLYIPPTHLCMVLTNTYMAKHVSGACNVACII